jgi:hypothetical protein
MYMEMRWRRVLVACIEKRSQRGFEFSGHDGVFPLIVDVLAIT